MRQWIGSALVQIIACRLFGAKPLSKPNAEILSILLEGTNLNEHLIKMQNFPFTIMHLKVSSEEWRPFCSGREELTWCLLLIVFTLHRCIWNVHSSQLHISDIFISPRALVLEVNKIRNNLFFFQNKSKIYPHITYQKSPGIPLVQTSHFKMATKMAAAATYLQQKWCLKN